MYAKQYLKPTVSSIWSLVALTDTPWTLSMEQLWQCTHLTQRTWLWLPPTPIWVKGGDNDMNQKIAPMFQKIPTLHVEIVGISKD